MKMNLSRVLAFLLAFCFMQRPFAQHQVKLADGKQVLRDTTRISQSLLDTLKQRYGKHKVYPASMEKIVLYTLSFLPELADNRIVFKVRPKGAPLSSRPAWGTLWRSAKKRQYMVFIRDSGEDSFFGSLFTKTSMPGKIGILGHELCHVSNFSRKTSLGLIWIGIAHVSKPYMDRFEFFTDSLVIEKGMGRYLQEWNGMFDKYFTDQAMPDPFKNKNTPTGERYMSAATIGRYMAKSSHPDYH